MLLKNNTFLRKNKAKTLYPSLLTKAIFATCSENERSLPYDIQLQ